MDWKKVFEMILLVIKLLIEQREKEAVQAAEAGAKASDAGDPVLGELRAMESKAQAACDCCDGA